MCGIVHGKDALVVAAALVVGGYGADFVLAGAEIGGRTKRKPETLPFILAGELELAGPSRPASPPGTSSVTVPARAVLRTVGQGDGEVVRTRSGGPEFSGGSSLTSMRGTIIDGPAALTVGLVVHPETGLASMQSVNRVRNRNEIQCQSRLFRGLQRLRPRSGIGPRNRYMSAADGARRKYGCVGWTGLSAQPGNDVHLSYVRARRAT